MGVEQGTGRALGADAGGRYRRSQHEEDHGDTDLDEALRLLTREAAPEILLVAPAEDPRANSLEGKLEGIVTKSDILRSLGDGVKSGGAHAARDHSGPPGSG